MVEMTVEYPGELRCRLTHGPSGSVVETDAPEDMGGKAARFSPTDLVSAALAACIATTLGIVAKRKGWKFEGIKVTVEKHMSTDTPRRIVRLPINLWMPITMSEDDKKHVEHVAHTCPVHKSIHPDIDAPVTIHWPS